MISENNKVSTLNCNGGLDTREKSIADDIESARLAHEQAQAQLAAYEEKMAAAHDEAAAVIADFPAQ